MIDSLNPMSILNMALLSIILTAAHKGEAGVERRLWLCIWAENLGLICTLKQLPLSFRGVFVEVYDTVAVLERWGHQFGNCQGPCSTGCKGLSRSLKLLPVSIGQSRASPLRLPKHCKADDVPSGKQTWSLPEKGAL